MARSRLCIFICLLASLHLRVISSQENYMSYELRRDNNWDALFTEDMNGDGNNDLIYPHYDPALGESFGFITNKMMEHFQQIPSVSRSKLKLLVRGSPI